jgi:hypothetical protein
MDIDREVDETGTLDDAEVWERRRALQRRNDAVPFRSPFGAPLQIEDHDVGLLLPTCPRCHALKFKDEDPSMCCMMGKVVLPPLEQPPEPLWTLLTKRDEASAQVPWFP